MRGLEDLRRQLEELRLEHQNLHTLVEQAMLRAPFDQIELQRLKKRKLLLKDQITKLESKLLPDLTA